LNPSTVDELAQVFKLIDEDTVEYVFGMLLEDPFDEADTRDFFCGILMEAVSS